VIRRILVVDDDPHVGRAIQGWLSGFRVQLADSRAAGLTALDHFGVVIVDVLIPDLRGLESIRPFHARAPTVPLIAISGSAVPPILAAHG
jgi:DNA-binding response OmpR family regulator